MKTRTTLAAGVLALAALGGAGCSAGHTAGRTAAVPATPTGPCGTYCASALPSSPSPGCTAMDTPYCTVAAVPGTNDNEYVVGPFTVTQRAFTRLPTQDDPADENGNPIPQTCMEVDAKNTSSGGNSFTGWVAPTVEYIKGHSLAGQVLGTVTADPTGGESGGTSDTLAPGQSQVLYACPPQSVKAGEYVTVQLISVQYGTPGVGTMSGTTVQLKY